MGNLWERTKHSGSGTGRRGKPEALGTDEEKSEPLIVPSKPGNLTRWDPVEGSGWAGLQNRRRERWPAH